MAFNRHGKVACYKLNIMESLNFQIILEDFIEPMFCVLSETLKEELWLCLEYMKFSNESASTTMSHLGLKHPWIPSLTKAYISLSDLNNNNPMPIQFNKKLFDDFRFRLISEHRATK
jgi:hypothetical protein